MRHQELRHREGFTFPEIRARNSYAEELRDDGDDIGIPWEMLPQEMGCGCGMTCWRRLRDWQAAGVWARLHRVLLDRLGAATAIDWRRCSLDGERAGQKGGEGTGPNPTDRGKPGPKHHVIADASGIPLAVRSARQRPDSRSSSIWSTPCRRSGSRGAAAPAPGQAARGQAYDPSLRRACAGAGSTPDRATGGREQ